MTASISLSELDPQQQFAALKIFMKKGEVVIDEREIEIPNTISARYVCAECGRFVVTTFYTIDIIGGVASRIKCSHCSGNMSLYLMGTGLETEVKKLRKKIQKRMDDYWKKG